MMIHATPCDVTAMSSSLVHAFLPGTTNFYRRYIFICVCNKNYWYEKERENAWVAEIQVPLGQKEIASVLRRIKVRVSEEVPPALKELEFQPPTHFLSFLLATVIRAMLRHYSPIYSYAITLLVVGARPLP